MKKTSNRYRAGPKQQAFNEDFEELRMITHEDDLEDQDEVNCAEYSQQIVETEQSEFRKLPQLDSFDSMNDVVIGKNDPFRNKNER